MSENSRLMSLVVAAVMLIPISVIADHVQASEKVVSHNFFYSQSRSDHPISTVQTYTVPPPLPVSSTEIKPPTSWGDERREPTPATTTTLPPYRRSAQDWRCDEWMDLARMVGWPEDQLPKLSYAIYRESRCRPDQHNPDDPMGGSNGLTQINQFWCKPTQYWPGGWLQAQGVLSHCDELYIPEVSLKASLAIWENSGWSPWNL